MQFESGFSFPSWVSDLGLRIVAFARMYDGYNLRLRISDIPSRAEIEIAHKNLSEIAQVPKLRGYARDTQSVLEDFHLALIVPCLIQRHKILDRLSRLRYSDGYFGRAACSSKNEIASLYRSASRSDNAKAHLFVAADRLDRAIARAANNYLTNRVPKILLDMTEFFDCVQECRNALPEFYAGLESF